MRRLFSTFARGAPGAGLLLLRVVAGASAITHAIVALSSGLPIAFALPQVLSLIAGALLMLGVWTPFSGSILAVLQIWEIGSARPTATSADILAGRELLLGTVSAALALLGPGAWSIDARIFGWRRIDVRDRTN